MKHLNRNSVAKTLVALCWLLVSSMGLAETKITYLHNDLLGSPVVATDEQGQVVWRKSYAPFGTEAAVFKPVVASNFGLCRLF